MRRRSGFVPLTLSLGVEPLKRKEGKYRHELIKVEYCETSCIVLDCICAFR